MSRLINKSGLDLIKKSENDNDPKSGYRTRMDIVDGKATQVVYYVPYSDIANVPTIGFGTIMYETGERVKLTDNSISEDRAYELLQYELKEKATAIETFSINNNIKLNDNQFAALCSLAYNCGPGAITNHDSAMRGALLRGDAVSIASAFRQWNKYTTKILGIPVKKVSNGLTLRREREILLFFKAAA